MSNANVVSMFDFGAPAKTDRNWSAQQTAIFDWFETSTVLTATIGDQLFAKAGERIKSQHLVVRACAGTGKTTTIIEAIGRAPEQSILLCAFNKKIAVELQERITNPNAEAATLHSIGFSCVKRYWERVRVADGSTRADSLTHKVAFNAPDAIKRIISKLHTKGREMAPHATTGADLRDIAVNFDCVPDEQWAAEGFGIDFVCERAAAAMAEAASTKPATGIDFADMLFLPIRNGWLRPKYDLVVVDEAQDMNSTQLEIAQGVVTKTGRIVVVGDNRQAIYGFRGADSESLDRLKAELGAVELGLTTTYRCGKAIVAEAQKLVPYFTAADSAPEGTVRNIDISKLMDEVRPADFVLSRTNAPLVRVALALIRAGRRTRIEGRDIGAGLRNLARKLSAGRAASSLPEFLRKLKVWEIKEAARAEEAGVQSKVDFIHDQAETLRALADGVAAVREIETRIDQLFGEGPVGSFIICSSVHRAKGLEADRVFVLRDTLYPQVACECGHRHVAGGSSCTRCDCDSYSPNPKAQREEQNIAYVAITRAKSELVWVAGR